MKDYVWLRPEIVAEIKFTEWTTGSVLRHPEFIDPQEWSLEAPFPMPLPSRWVVSHGTQAPGRIA
jgi:hypothetical protein